MMNPKAREQELLIKELTDETVVYDRRRDKAHCLNRTAALIWRQCDGRTSVGQLVTLLRKQELPADEAVVWLALDGLAKAHLLEERLTRPREAAGISRRQVVRKLGMVGGLTMLLPAIRSLSAPASAQAVSGGGCCCCANGECSAGFTFCPACETFCKELDSTVKDCQPNGTCFTGPNECACTT